MDFKVGKLFCVPMLHVVGFILDVFLVFHSKCVKMKTTCITNELLVQINPEEYNSEKYVLYVHKPTYFVYVNI